eukprot:jgi/Mesen1/6887/ME000353S05911
MHVIVPHAYNLRGISTRHVYALVVKELEKGQGTAIVTGAIAVLLGVGYLVLVQILDTRGTTLIPPPPEAFGL